MATNSIKLSSSDGIIRYWDREVVDKCEVLQRMLSLLSDDDDDEPIPVPVRAVVLDEMEGWLRLTPVAPGADRADRPQLNTDILLPELLHAADFLHVERLVEAVIAEVVEVILTSGNADAVAAALGVELGVDPLADVPLHLKKAIMSGVGARDWQALLDVVADVCDEWHELAVDPETWAQVEVDDSIPQPFDFVRLLRQAPAVHILRYPDFPRLDEATLQALSTALGKSKLVVLQRVVVDFRNLRQLTASSTSAVLTSTRILDLLWRSRDVLEEVHLNFGFLDLAESVRDRTLATVLAGMRALRKLKISLIKPPSPEHFSGMEPFTGLTKLIFDTGCYTTVADSDSVCHMLTMLEHLLFAARASLERLAICNLKWHKLSMQQRLSFGSALRQCSRMKALKGPASPVIVDAATTWPELQTLNLDFHFDPKWKLVWPVWPWEQHGHMDLDFGEVHFVLDVCRLLRTKGVRVSLQRVNSWEWSQNGNARTQIDEELRQFCTEAV